MKSRFGWSLSSHASCEEDSYLIAICQLWAAPTTYVLTNSYLPTLRASLSLSFSVQRVVLAPAYAPLQQAHGRLNSANPPEPAWIPPWNPPAELRNSGEWSNAQRGQPRRPWFLGFRLCICNFTMYGLYACVVFHVGSHFLLRCLTLS